MKESERGPLLPAAEEAIRGRDRRRTVAVLEKLLSRGEGEQEIVGLLRRFAISEDEALHAEKYYRTVAEERATIRPRFRANQLLALGRVTASAFRVSRRDTKRRGNCCACRKSCSCRRSLISSNPTCHGSLGSRGPRPLPAGGLFLRNHGTQRTSALWEPALRIHRSP